MALWEHSVDLNKEASSAFTESERKVYEDFAKDLKSKIDLQSAGEKGNRKLLLDAVNTTKLKFGDTEVAFSQVLAGVISGRVDNPFYADLIKSGENGSELAFILNTLLSISGENRDDSHLNILKSWMTGNVLWGEIQAPMTDEGLKSLLAIDKNAKDPERTEEGDEKYGEASVSYYYRSGKWGRDWTKAGENADKNFAPLFPEKYNFKEMQYHLQVTVSGGVDSDPMNSAPAEFTDADAIAKRLLTEAAYNSLVSKTINATHFNSEWNKKLAFVRGVSSVLSAYAIKFGDREWDVSEYFRTGQTLAGLNQLLTSWKLKDFDASAYPLDFSFDDFVQWESKDASQKTNDRMSTIKVKVPGGQSGALQGIAAWGDQQPVDDKFDDKNNLLHPYPVWNSLIRAFSTEKESSASIDNYVNTLFDRIAKNPEDSFNHTQFYLTDLDESTWPSLLKFMSSLSQDEVNRFYELMVIKFPNMTKMHFGADARLPDDFSQFQNLNTIHIAQPSTWRDLRAIETMTNCKNLRITQASAADLANCDLSKLAELENFSLQASDKSIDEKFLNSIDWSKMPHLKNIDFQTHVVLKDISQTIKALPEDLASLKLSNSDLSLDSRTALLKFDSKKTSFVLNKTAWNRDFSVF